MMNSVRIWLNRAVAHYGLETTERKYNSIIRWGVTFAALFHWLQSSVLVGRDSFRMHTSGQFYSLPTRTCLILLMSPLPPPWHWTKSSLRMELNEKKIRAHHPLQNVDQYMYHKLLSAMSQRTVCTGMVINLPQEPKPERRLIGSLVDVPNQIAPSLIHLSTLYFEFFFRNRKQLFNVLYLVEIILHLFSTIKTSQMIN